MKCILCKTQIEPALSNDDELIPPLRAVVFSSSGNFGSTVFDPMTSSLQIEIFMCDSCLEKEVAAGNVQQVVTREKVEYERTVINELPDI